MKQKPLSAFRKRFAVEVGGNGKNGTQAVIAIHPKTSPEAAAVTAHRLMQDERVRERIKHYAGPLAGGEITLRMLNYMEVHGLEFWLSHPGRKRLSASEAREYLRHRPRPSVGDLEVSNVDQQ